jgi:hypothetical protein
VKFRDGSMGFFSPGGPSKMLTYSFCEGHRPGDESLRGVRPSELATAKARIREDYPDDVERLYDEAAPSLPPGTRKA